MQERHETIRTPRQLRSQKRVETILDAAKSLIQSKGCAQLKMGDIAKQAGISASSIYQYFPNKGAIIGALAQHYLDINRAKVEETFATPPKDLIELSAAMKAMFDAYVDLHQNDPVVRDIWMGSASDKQLQDIDNEDTRRNAELAFVSSKHLFQEQHYERAQVALLIISSFAGTAVATIIALENQAGDLVFEESKRMLAACWKASVEPLGRPEALGRPCQPDPSLPAISEERL